jgi:stearoyl-CoA desaturase (delta-9 desaturase)
MGWLFGANPVWAERYAADLLRDRDLRALQALYPLLAVGSFAFPFLVGWGWTGEIAGAWTAFFWAGVVRMAVLHHVTWSINSICHCIGRRPFARGDESTNVAALALVSLGESWHNFHHAHPGCARHGARPGQWDPSAGLIRVFERAGWATSVRWPTPEHWA